MKVLLGVFGYLDDAKKAYHTLKEKGYIIDRFYSPVPVPDIETDMMPKPSNIRWIVLFGSLLGIAIALALTIGTSVAWPLVVGGKPIISLPPFIVITFELMVLFGSIINLLGMFGLARLPKFNYEKGYLPEFSDNKFGILIKVPEGKVSEVKTIMEEAFSEEIHEVS